MTDVDTSLEAVERLAARLDIWPTKDLSATLRALVAERDELLAELRATHEKHKHAQEMWAMHASSDRTHRAECDRLAAENALIRLAWLRVIQSENYCDQSGSECQAKRCGCAKEMELYISEAQEPRND